MIYILITLLIIFSFPIIMLLKKQVGYKKLKPLSKMTKKEFKKAMKDLEIK